MEEEIIIEREFIEEAKRRMAADPKLRPCALCFHFDSEKKVVQIHKEA